MRVAVGLVCHRACYGHCDVGINRCACWWNIRRRASSGALSSRRDTDCNGFAPVGDYQYQSASGSPLAAYPLWYTRRVSHRLAIFSGDPSLCYSYFGFNSRVYCQSWQCALWLSIALHLWHRNRCANCTCRYKPRHSFITATTGLLVVGGSPPQRRNPHWAGLLLALASIIRYGPQRKKLVVPGNSHTHHNASGQTVKDLVWGNPLKKWLDMMRQFWARFVLTAPILHIHWPDELTISQVSL